MGLEAEGSSCGAQQAFAKGLPICSHLPGLAKLQCPAAGMPPISMHLATMVCVAMTLLYINWLSPVSSAELASPVSCWLQVVNLKTVVFTAGPYGCDVQVALQKRQRTAPPAVPSYTDIAIRA